MQATYRSSCGSNSRGTGPTSQNILTVLYAVRPVLAEQNKPYLKTAMLGFLLISNRIQSRAILDTYSSDIPKNLAQMSSAPAVESFVDGGINGGTDRARPYYPQFHLPPSGGSRRKL